MTQSNDYAEICIIDQNGIKKNEFFYNWVWSYRKYVVNLPHKTISYYYEIQNTALFPLPADGK